MIEEQHSIEWNKQKEMDLQKETLRIKQRYKESYPNSILPWEREGYVKPEENVENRRQSRKTITSSSKNRRK